MKPNPILCGPRVSDMILNSRLYKNVLNMKALLFHKFKNICTLVQYKDNTLDKEYKSFHYFCTWELSEKRPFKAVSTI